MLRLGVIRKKSKDEGTSYFNNSTPQWERALKFIRPLLDKMILKNKSLNGIRVLDVGCGCGDLANYLAMQGATVTGVDVASDMISKAKTNYASQANLNFIVSDVSSLELNTQFDLIVSTSALQWVKDASIQEAIKRIGNHLKADGELFILIPTYDFPHLIIKNVVAESECWQANFSNYREQQNLTRDYLPLLKSVGFSAITVAFKDTPHELTPEEFVNFTQQWCGCYLEISELARLTEFKQAILLALHEHASVKNGKVKFEQTSLVITARKPKELQEQNTLYLPSLKK